MVQHNEQHTESGKLIEDAGALRSGLCDLISSLPKVDYWQTGQSTTTLHTRTSTHQNTHAYTYHSVINTQACWWQWKQGHGLKTFTQHATSSPKQTRELDGGGGGGERKNWLSGYLWKRRLEVLSVLLQSDRRGEKEGSEEKKRRQVYREALTDHRWLKDMWKGCSQNTVLPSWTFYSAVSCSWCKRQRKRNTPVNSCLSLDSWEEWNLRLSVWRLRSVAKRGLHWQFGHGCSCGDGHTLLVKRFTDGNTSEGSPHQCEAKIQPLKVGNLYYHKIKSILSF